VDLFFACIYIDKIYQTGYTILGKYAIGGVGKMNRVEISISSLVKAIIILAIGLLLVIQTPTFATTGKSTGECVRVREKPSTESEIVELLDVNDVVEILGKEGDWYKIKFNGTIGYVSQSFISTNDGTVNNNINNETNNNNNIQSSNEKENETQKEQNNNELNENTESNTQTTTVSKVYKMAEDSKVRILPIVSAEEIGDAKKGESVSLISNAGLWVYIKSGSVSGWVRIDKLSSEDVVVANNNAQAEDNKTNNNDKAQTVEIPAKKMYASLAAINIRSESNTTSEIIDAITLNDEVTVVGEENGWYKVQVNGSTGYIRKDLLSNDKTEVSSRNNGLDRAAAQSNMQNANDSVVVSSVESLESVPVSASGVSGSDIAAYAQQFVGCSYVYGACGPYSFDCSGLTKYVYAHFGYNLNRSSRDQAVQGVEVTGELQPGDILVFSNDGKQVGHVGIYIGNDKFVHASDSSTGVIISNLHDSWNIKKYWGARRII
jgi:probable enterotoxin B